MIASTGRVVDLLVVWGAIGVLMLLMVAKAIGHPLPAPGPLLIWFVLPFGGAAILARGGALDLLGLTRFDGRGVAVALGGSLVMLACLAATVETGPHLDLVALWDGALRPGLAEELLFRGLAFGVLFWRVGWSFRAAMLSTGIVFGCFHLPGALVDGTLSQAWGAVAITAAGGCWFAWLFVRWSRSLWVPIVAHTAINAWWVLYSVGPNAAAGGSGALWGRIGAIAAITVVTLKLTEDPTTPSETDPVG